MQLHNSLSKKIEAFKPRKDNIITIYSCGPTVYERAHIGNLASFIYADTLRRTLSQAYPTAKVQHVMNMTDVDDKTIKSSQEEFPELEPMKALKKLTKSYEDLFLKDLAAVGVDVDAIHFVRATDYIPQMQVLINELVKAGIAYVSDDGIYFSIAKYKVTGKKYGQLVDITAESTGAARVNNDEYVKDYIHDFALWKKQKPDEPAWDFMIDNHNLKGRPGWHIECSAMSVSELGQPFDIHTGGVDLKFPHHENEIAQSTATHDEKLLADFFFHSEHLLVDGQKMSKSLKNFYTLEDIMSKKIDPLALRLLVLQAHYRSQAHFSWTNLQAAQNRLESFAAWADRRHQSSVPVMSEELDVLWRDSLESIKTHMLNDVNGPGAFASLGQLINWMDKQPIPSQDGVYSDGALKQIDQWFGLSLDNRPDITAEQKQLIAQREQARSSDQWEKSDELRNKLLELGVGLRDTPNGAIWYRVSVAPSLD